MFYDYIMFNYYLTYELIMLFILSNYFVYIPATHVLVWVTYNWIFFPTIS